MAKNPTHYAIVIGIDKYSQLRVLSGSTGDAALFAIWLKADDGGGVPEENIEMVVSGGSFPQNPIDARPAVFQIDDALTKIGLTKPGKIGSRLYFYFAGHGFGPTFDDVGMLMANAAEERMGLGYNIGLRPFRRFLQQSEAFDEIIFILDCCRDPVITVNTYEPGIKPGNVGNGTEVRQVAVLAAEYGAKAFQKNNVGPDEPRGILTKALLQGLKNPNAADGLGRFTATSVFSYVRDLVPTLTTDPKLQQHPRVDPNPEPEIVFSTIPESLLERVNVEVSVDPKYTGTLILKDNNNQPIVKQPATGLTKASPWRIILLRSRWYSLFHSNDGGVTTGAPQIIDLTQATNPYEFVFK